MRAPAVSFSALRGGFFRLCVALTLAGHLGPIYASPSPIDTQFDDQDILVTLPEPALATTAAPSEPEALADLIQAQIQRSRSTGDPRFLGYAEGLLQQWQGKLTDRLRVLQATIDQSNHRFDAARQTLNKLVNTSDNRQQVLQARLMLANMSLVQGRYDDAVQQCNDLSRSLPGLISASCQAQALARTGQPEAAYRQLRYHLEQAGGAGQTARLWVQGTLGDIAAQLGDPAAAQHWKTVLDARPDDLYIRAQLADWALERGMLNRALALTEGYEQVDSLAVIRAIALKQAGDPDARRLADVIEARFAEAQWRGNLLHKRDFARFQLDVSGNAQSALEAARENWQDQREPADTRLLLRAANATGNERLIQTLQAWLDDHNQQDARYPEVRP